MDVSFLEEINWIQVVVIAAAIMCAYYLIRAVFLSDSVELQIKKTRFARRQKQSQKEVRKYQKKAWKLAKKKRVREAINLLEEHELFQDAVALLREQGMLHEAARIYNRFFQYEKSGDLYASFGRWKEAYDSYVIGHCHLKAAQSCLELENWRGAASHFEQGEELEQAGHYWKKVEEFRRAGRIFIRSGNLSEAIKTYLKLWRKNPGAWQEAHFDQIEINAFLAFTKTGRFEEPILEVLRGAKKIHKLIIYFCQKGKVQQAVKVFRENEEYIEDQSLFVEFEPDRDSVELIEHLATMFSQLEKFQMAGVLFEKLGRNEDAENAFNQINSKDNRSQHTSYIPSYLIQEEVNVHEGDTITSRDGNKSHSILSNTLKGQTLNSSLYFELFKKHWLMDQFLDFELDWMWKNGGLLQFQPYEIKQISTPNEANAFYLLLSGTVDCVAGSKVIIVQESGIIGEKQFFANISEDLQLNFSSESVAYTVAAGELSKLIFSDHSIFERLSKNYTAHLWEKILSFK